MGWKSTDSMKLMWMIQVDVILTGLCLLILVFWSGYWLIHVLGIIYGKWKLHRKPKLDPEDVLPGVSVIKPLLGVDSNLASNLETFFLLDYAKYELLFCVQEECDPSLMLVKTMVAKYPNVDSSIFIGGKDVGLNPKINNMMPAYEACKYEFILISDAGIKMKPDTLTDIVCAMKDKVGIVTQMPYCCDRQGFAATQEKVYFGTSHARIYLGADSLGFVCSTGMSSLMRKSVLDEVGGFPAFGQFIAEDYFFAHAIASRGWKCGISSQPAWQNSGVCQVSKFHERLSRWAKLRFAMLPHTIVLEPLQECFLLGLLASWAVNVLLLWNSLIFFLVHVLVWMLLDYILLCTVQNGPLPFSKFEFVVSWIFRELTALPLFLRSLWNQNISWRAGTYKLRWGGLAEEVRPKR